MAVRPAARSEAGAAAKATESAERTSRQPGLLAAGLALLTLAVYWKTSTFGHIICDDESYVFHNPVVLKGLTLSGLAWAFDGVHASNWHPLTWLSHMADVSMYGPAPQHHHITSIVLHSLSAALLLIALHRLTSALWESAFVAAMFALHPLHVESVTWIAERKDVLSGLFFMLCLILYSRYVENPRRSAYALLVATFAAGLLAKQMLVTLPFVLLLLDWWPLGRATDASSWRRLFIEKLPLVALSVAASVVVFFAQRNDAMVSLAEIPFPLRVECAIVAYARYLRDVIWPSELVVLYPYPREIPTVVWASCLIALDVLTAAVWFARKRAPYALMGWLWYAGMLLPVIGIVQVGAQWRADRYTYLPIIGIFIAIAWGVSHLVRAFHVPRPVTAVATVVAVFLAAGCTWHQLDYWRNGETIFRHALDTGNDSSIAELNVAVAIARQHRLRESVPFFERGLEMDPSSFGAHADFGDVLSDLGQPRAAAAEWQAALRYDPDLPSVRNSLGAQLGEEGHFDEAREQFERALQVDPNYVPALLNLGKIAVHSGDAATAARYFDQVLAIDPNEREALAALAALRHR